MGLEILVAKLKQATVALRVWNKTMFGHVDNMISDLEDRLICLEDSLQASGDHVVE